MQLTPSFYEIRVGCGVEDIFVLVAKCYVKLSFITKSTFCLAMKYKIVNFAAE